MDNEQYTDVSQKKTNKKEHFRQQAGQFFLNFVLPQKQKKSITEQLIKFAFVIAFAILAMGVTYYYIGGKINLTDSVAKGFYRLNTSLPIKSGAYVQVCLNKEISKGAFERGYIAKGTCKTGYEPLLKKLIGVPGDTAAIYKNGMVVNDKFYPAAQLDRDGNGNPLQGQKMPSQKLTGYLLYGDGDSKNSWDSRYYGQVTRDQIIGVMR